MKQTYKNPARQMAGLRQILTFGALTFGVSLIPFAHAYAIDDLALPSGGTVVGGSATLDYGTPGQLDVHQSSNLAVINWNSFNIGQNATTQFYQPGPSSITVNRVTGDHQDPSQILGTLRANGSVFVLDKNGVIFGANSTVNVGSIVASTGDIDTNAFMHGDTKLTITNADSGGSIVNNGNITVAEAGLAAFVAPNVVNNGVIQAKLGRVALATGDTATVDLYGDGLVEIAVNDPATNAAITNKGTISAEGGTVLMTASAAKDIVDSVINTTGIVDVSSATVQGGKIILEGANTEVSGTLDASGKTGGGSIRIGGDYQGGGTVKHADRITITKDAVIKANATDAGKGGSIIVWSDKNTAIAGTLEAKGGIHGGDGGFIETSSAKHMDIDLDTNVFVGAAAGNGGEWLLDPEDIVISDGGNDGDAATTDVASATINSALNGGGNVTITTAAGPSGSGNITLNNATINKSTANNAATLTLQAINTIYMGTSTINSTSGDALNVVFNADRDGDHVGSVNLNNSSITTSGGYVVMGGGSGALGGTNGILGDGDGTGADDVAAWGTAAFNKGINLNNGDISTSSGSMYLTGHGLDDAATSTHVGIYITSGSLLQTTSGSMKFKGTGGAGTTSNNGFYMQNTGTILQTSTGAITITGQAAAGTGNSNLGVRITDGSGISSSGANAGDIRITGTGAGVDSLYNYGVIISGTTGKPAYITSANGDIYIDAYGGGTGTSTSGNGFLFGQNDTYITSTGSTADAANITINGTAANQTGAVGIYFDSVNGLAYIKTITGNINLVGTTPAAAAGAISIVHGNATTPVIESTGSGSISLTAINPNNTYNSLFGGYEDSIIGGASMTGTLSLIADRLDLTALTLKTASTGTILLKPYNASQTIGLGGGTGGFNLTDAELAKILATGKLIIGDSAAGTGDVVVDSWDLSGKNFNVELYGNDITFQDTDATVGIDYGLNLGSGNFLAHAMDAGADLGTISLNAATLKSVAGSSSLTLRADKDIGFSTGSNITATTGSLNLTLNSDRDADQDGAILITSSSIATNGGSITMGGGSGAITAGTGYAVGNAFSKYGVYFNSAVNAGGGDIVINGKGYADVSDTNNGVMIVNNLGTTGTGKIDINGIGDGSGISKNDYGVQQTAGTISTVSGNLNITGTAGNGPNGNNYGVLIATTVQSTSGTITLTGQGSNNASSNPYGFAMFSGSILNTSGDIFIVAASGTNTSAAARTAFRMSNGTIDSGSGNTTITATGGADYVLTSGNIGTATTTGNITINGDTFDNTGATIRTLGTITVKPRTAAATIGLGGGSGILNLSDAELGYFTAGTLVIGNSAAGTGDVMIDSWDLSGKAYNVEVYGNDITLQDTDATVGIDYALKLGTGNFLAYAKDAGADLGTLTANAAFLKSIAGSSSLTLQAGRDISLSSAPITVTTGSLNLTLNSDRNADQDGAILLTSSAISTNGGSITMGGGSGTITAGTGFAVGNSFSKYGISYDLAINAGGGDIILNGKGYADVGDQNYGVYILNPLSTTNAGTIKIAGIGGGTTTSSTNYGVLVGSAVTTSSGNLMITGTGGNSSGSGGSNYGMNLSSTVQSTSGNITLTGQGSSGSTSGPYGVLMNSGSILNTSGDIVIVANAGTNASATSKTGFRMTGGTINSGSGSTTITGNGVTDFNLTGGAIGTSSTTGNITLNGDTFDNTGTTIRSSGTITIKPRTASTTIGLGGGTGGLNLTDAELDYFTAGTLVIGDSAAGTGDIIVDSWDLSGKTHNIELYGNDITFQDTDATTGVDYALKLGTGNFTAMAKDNGSDYGSLTLNAAILKALTGTSYLNFMADQYISLTSNITATNGILNTLLNADRNLNQDGRIVFWNSTINTNDGYFVAGGGSGALGGTDGILGNGDGTGADDVSATAPSASTAGIDLTGTNIQTGAGDLILTGTGGGAAGQVGVGLVTSTLQTSSGHIRLKGNGGTGTSAGGSGIYTSSATIQSDTGNIDLYGYSKGTGDASGIDRTVALTSSTIKTTTTTDGLGNISIYGDASASGASQKRGFEATVAIQTKAGDISIRTTGTGAAGITFWQDNTVESLNGGDIHLNAGNAQLVLNASASTYGTTIGSAGTNLVDIVAQEIAINAVLSPTKTNFLGHTVSVKPYDSSSAIGLGGGSGTLNISDAELAFFNPTNKLIIGDSVSGTGDIDLDSWNLSGKTYNVELYGNGIDIGGLTLGTGDFMAYAMDNAAIDPGTLTVSAATTKSVAGTSSLTFRADKDIIFGSGANITASGTGILNTVLNADRDADHDGAISITSSAITTNGGYTVLGGGSGALGGTDGILGNGDGTGADDVAAWGNGTYVSGIALNNGDISTAGGSINLHGHGQNDSATNAQYGLNIYNNSVLQTITGDINLTGIGGNGKNDNDGLVINTTSEINSEKGTIRLVGTGGSAGTGSDSDGVVIYNSSKVSSTGTGSDAAKIYITGTGTGSDPGNNGFIIGYSTVTSQKGDIEITGTGANTAFSRGIYFNGAGKIESTGNANIKLTGNSITDFLLYSSAGEDKIIGGANDTGNITLIGNTFDLQAGANIQTGGSVLFKPRTASTSIGLGGASGTLNLTDAELGYINAGTLIIGDSAVGTGDVAIDSWDLSGKTHNAQIFGKNFDVGGIKTGAGNVYLYGQNGSITVSGSSVSNAAGNLYLLSTGDVSVNNALTNTGTGQVNIFAGWDGTSGITTPALFNRDNIDLSLTARNITLGTNGRISSGGTGTAVLLASKGNFVNNASIGANAITASSGRYLVYSNNPIDTAKGGLTGKSLYNEAFSTNKPSTITQTGSRFIYAYQPILTITADDISATDPAGISYSYHVSGLINGDLAGDAFGGTPSYVLGTQYYNTRPIQITQGSGTSPVGYLVNYVNGVLTLTTTPPPTPPSPPPVSTPVPTETSTLINQIVNIPMTSSVSNTTGNATQASADKTPTDKKSVSADCLMSDASNSCIIQ